MTNDLVLNIVPVSFDNDQMTIGRLQNVEGTEYRKLREEHWQTHAFRYDSRYAEILSVAIDTDLPPIGRRDMVDIQEHLLLAARAIQHSILVWLANRRPILRDSKQLVFWGQANDALLLSKAVSNVGQKKVTDIEVALRYEIDCRMFAYDDEFFLGIIIDLTTSNIIDIPISELKKQGLELLGRYVCHHVPMEQEYLRPKIDLIGRVGGIDGNYLLLTDTAGATRVPANDVFLEPRAENLKDVVELYYGSWSPRVLSKLKDLRAPIATAIGKLARIENALTGLKQHPIVISGDVNVVLGELLTESDERFPKKISTTRPSLLFGPQGREHATIPDIGITKHGPYMYLQHRLNAPVIAVVCESQYRGRVEQFIRFIRDGYPDNLWKNQRRSNPFPEGLIGKYRLSRMHFEYEECTSPTAASYRDAANRLLERLPEPPSLAIVQTRTDFLSLYGDQNPYLITKSIFMMAGIPTQAVRISNIELSGDGPAYLLNNIALAIYAKLDGTPWVMSAIGPTTHELVVGLGATEIRKGRLGEGNTYVGITSVFQGDGRYLVWGSTREVEFSRYSEALLASLSAVVKYVQQHNAWQEGDRVRIVCHVYKRLRDCEVEAIKQLVNLLIDEKYVVEFAFLDISWWHPYHIFDPSQLGVDYWDRGKKRTKGKGVSERGLCYQLDRSRGLLQLTGPREIKTIEHGSPKPLMIELHKDSDFTDMSYLLRQVYHFSFMSWRSFFPASEPVTIGYSRLIARLLGNLNSVSGWNSQVLTFGELRDRRWFL